MAMSSCRLAGVWLEDEVVEVVMVEFRLWAWNRSFFCLRDSCWDLSVNNNNLWFLKLGLVWHFFTSI